MKINRQEAQRVRESQLHELRQPLGAVSTPQQPVAQPKVAPPENGLGKLRQKLTQWFATRSEPRITAITDPSGQTWWRAYNPQTQELKWLTSEAEVMRWLDTQPCI